MGLIAAPYLPERGGQAADPVAHERLHEFTGFERALVQAEAFQHRFYVDVEGQPL